MYKCFDKNNKLEVCPDDFKESVVRPGKRKTTKRTPKKGESDSILFTIDEKIGDKYMDIMFSFIKSEKKESVYDPHHTRTYFFYDFMDFLSANKKGLLGFRNPISI